MKILELDLIAYGPFSGTKLDLSQGEHGLHLVLGNNAVGKSSTLRAITGLLYGIPSRTSDDHLHRMKDLRIGGRLRHSNGTELSIVRRKGRKSTIMGPSGESLGDDVLDAYLTGVPLQRFTDTLGIDHDRLVEGGRRVLEGKGDVAELLMESGLGGAQINRVRELFERQADTLFGPTASTRPINRSIREYSDAKKRERELAVAPDEWREKSERLATRLAKRDALDKERAALASRGARVGRLQKTLPKVARLQSLQSELETMRDVPDLPADASEQRKQAERALREAQLSERRALDRTAELTTKLAKLVIPERLIEHSEQIGPLHATYDSYDKSGREMPRLVAQIEQVDAQVRRLLCDLYPDLSVDQLETVRPPRGFKARIDELADTKPKLTVALAHHKDRVDGRVRRLATLESQIDALGLVDDSSELEGLIRRVEKDGDLTSRWEDAAALLRETEARAEAGVRRLSGWSDSFDALESCDVPGRETVMRFCRESDAITADFDRLTERRADLDRRRKTAALELDTLHRSGSLPSEAGLTAARACRQEAWETLLRVGLSDVAAVERFDGSVLDADQVADRLRNETDRVVRGARLSAELLQVDQDLAACGSEDERHAERAADFQARWTHAWAGAGLSPLPPHEMISWLDAYEGLLSLADVKRTQHQDASRLEERLRRHQQSLVTALRQHRVEPTGASLSELLETARQHVASLQSLMQKHRAIASRIEEEESELDHDRQQLNQSEIELAHWTNAWSEAIRFLALPTQVGVAEARAAMERLDALFVHVDELKDLKIRLQELEQDRARYETRVHHVVEMVAQDLVHVPVESSVDMLQRRLAQARLDAVTFENLSEHLQQTESALADARRTIAAESAQLKMLVERARVADISGLEPVEQLCDKRRIVRDECHGLSEQLVDLGDGATLAEVLDEARCAKREALEHERIQVERRTADVERDMSFLDQEIGRLRGQLDELDGRADAAVAAQEAEEASSSLQTLVHRFARLKVGAHLLRRHIESYRERYQGPL